MILLKHLILIFKAVEKAFNVLGWTNTFSLTLKEEANLLQRFDLILQGATPCGHFIVSLQY